jgi:hypothetical protein
VLNAAAPDEFKLPVPICVPPSLKITGPVGTPDPETGAIEAVNVTACPKVTCADDATSEAFVAAGVELAGMNTKTVAEYAGKLQLTAFDATDTGVPATICVMFALL